MKKLVAVTVGLALLTLVVAPRAEARHEAAFAVGALTGAIFAGALATSYHAQPRTVVVPQPVYPPVYQPVYQPIYRPVYPAPVMSVPAAPVYGAPVSVTPVYSGAWYYDASFGWYYR